MQLLINFACKLLINFTYSYSPFHCSYTLTSLASYSYFHLKLLVLSPAVTH